MPRRPRPSVPTQPIGEIFGYPISNTSFQSARAMDQKLCQGYTNDGTVSQHKAQIVLHGTGPSGQEQWTSTIRTLPSLTRVHSDLAGAQTYVQLVVEKLINVGHDFYGPDMDIVPTGCDA
jgi:hypothetical protein